MIAIFIFALREAARKGELKSAYAFVAVICPATNCYKLQVNAFFAGAIGCEGNTVTIQISWGWIALMSG
jgi:hypothetical protein